VHRSSRASRIIGRMHNRTPIRLLLLAACLPLAACNSGAVSSEEGARLAYVGLHHMVDRAINLGLDGYNAASSANIPAQDGVGDVTGTITITGQVDQGASSNKEMRLYVELIDYQDELQLEEDELERAITYDTRSDALPYLQLSLRNIPNGTFVGSLTGFFDMTGDLDGAVELRLSMDGQIEEVPGSDGEIRRVPGSTAITGEAESDYGVYAVDLTI
jgi:hypothetical protein